MHLKPKILSLSNVSPWAQGKIVSLHACMGAVTSVVSDSLGPYEL